MIGKLKGTIDTIENDHVLLDVGGVCYEVFCSSATLRNLHGEGTAAELWIETHVREDHFHLYGFASKQEKQTFLTLNKVNGVGTKMALAILSQLSFDQLVMAIASEDKAALTQVSGVGPKLASRMLNELKDAFNDTDLTIGSASAVSGTSAPVAATGNALFTSDAVAALTGLGFGRSDAFTVVARIAANNPDADTQTLIKLALKEMSMA